MIGIHRVECGCSYCVHPVVTRVINNGPKQPAPWQQEVWDVLGTAPSDWYGGREATDPPALWRYDCWHIHTTRYDTGTFCRDCARWLAE